MSVTVEVIGPNNRGSNSVSFTLYNVKGER